MADLVPQIKKDQCCYLTVNTAHISFEWFCHDFRNMVFLFKVRQREVSFKILVRKSFQSRLAPTLESTVVEIFFFPFQSEDVFLEAQVQNVTSGHLCLEKVSLEPSPMFRMASLNSIAVDGDAEKEVPVFGRINFLQPQDSRQYLFSLTPRNDLRTNYKQLRGATNIGTRNFCHLFLTQIILAIESFKIFFEAEILMTEQFFE